MKILHVNKFLYRRGGAESYMHGVAERQRRAGHDVEFFGVTHPENPPMVYEQNFPSLVEFDHHPRGLADKARALGRMLYSSSARRGIDAVARDFMPDVVHLHNIYHGLSPSILRPLEELQIPVVMTLHDYKLACPTYHFLDHGTICEACVGRRFHQAAIHRCKDDSFLASAAGSLELGLHTFLGAYDPVRILICPSLFLTEKMREAGVYPTRLRTLHNFVDVSTIAPKQEPGGRLAYAGRLSVEKGVDTLIEAVGRSPGVQLDVAGEGNLRVELERQAADVAPGRVRFLGRIDREQVYDLLRSSIALVVPSRWYENQPMSILEAYACGVPVVATNLGGNIELVDEGGTGWLFANNDARMLSGILRRVVDDPQEAWRRGQVARRFIEEKFSPQDHLDRLDGLYAEAALGVAA